MAVSKDNITIYDIAEKAGVSANTVSRALNGKPGVAEKTRARIFTVAKALRYQPHIGARSLRTKQEGSIGVIYPAPPDVVPLSANFFLFLCSELYRIFGTQGERIFLDLNPLAVSDNDDYARSIWQKLCSACLLAGPLGINDTTISRIHQSGIPYLAFGRLDSLPDCSCATVDFEQSAYESVSYFAARGHKGIGMLKAFSGFQPGVERRRGYTKALKECELSYDERLVQPVSFHFENVIKATYRLLNDTSVTALIDASGLENASAIREGARLAGRTPGEDFELLCWTYAIDTVIMEDACAHLFLPVREAASEGIELLADWYWKRREEPIHIVYNPTLVDTKDLSSLKKTTPEGFNSLFEKKL